MKPWMVMLICIVTAVLSMMIANDQFNQVIEWDETEILMSDPMMDRNKERDDHAIEDVIDDYSAWYPGDPIDEFLMVPGQAYWIFSATVVNDIPYPMD